MAITNAIKLSFEAWKNRIGHITIFIGTLCSIVSLFMGWLNTIIPPIYITATKIALIYACVAALILMVCKTIREGTAPIPAGLHQPGQSQPRFIFSSKMRNRAKICQQILYWLPVLLMIWLVSIFWTEKGKCEKQQMITGVKLYKFTDTEKDPFSASVYNYLQDNTTSHSLVIDTVNQFINLNKIRQPSDAIPLLGCFGKGLIVFGNRTKEEGSFYCKICIKNIRDEITDTIGPSNRIITIQDPPYFDIKFDKQYEVVSKVVLALINYQQNSFDLTISLLKPIVENRQINNPKFIAACYLIMGNSHFKKKDISTALELYKIGVNFDRDNPLLQGNLLAIAKDSFETARFIIENLPKGFNTNIQDSEELEWYHEHVWRPLGAFKNLIAIGKFGCIYQNAEGLWDGAIYSKVGVTKIFFNSPDLGSAQLEFDRFLGLASVPPGKKYPFDFNNP
jgi:hypothetical protein